MKKKSLTALFAILASIFFCFTTVQAGDDGSWRQVNPYDDIIGKWEGTKTIAIKDEDMPESSLNMTLSFECIKHSNDSMSATINMRIDLDKFLTDFLNSDPAMETLGIQKDDLWEQFLEAKPQFDNEYTITTGKYYINMFIADSGKIAVGSNKTAIDDFNLWINADKSQIKIIYDEPFSFGLGDEGIKELILDRK